MQVIKLVIGHKDTLKKELQTRTVNVLMNNSINKSGYHNNDWLKIIMNFKENFNVQINCILKPFDC